MNHCYFCAKPVDRAPNDGKQHICKECEKKQPINITTYKGRPSTKQAYRSDAPVPHERLESARFLAHLTLEQLAEQTGIGDADLVMFETGFLAPTPEQVERIAEATGFPVAWFYQPWKPAFNMEDTSLRFH